MKVDFPNAVSIYHENYIEISGNLFALVSEGMVTEMENYMLTVIPIL
jgi:hypothetical protein